MKKSQDSIREESLHDLLLLVVDKIKEVEKAQERVEQKFDNNESRRYSDSDFEVNERNDC